MRSERIWLAVVAILVLALPTAAMAESADDARKQAEQFEQQADDAEQRARDLADQTDQVEARVAEIVEKVGEVETQLAAARAHADDVEQRLEAAGRALEAAELQADKAATRAELARRKSERADADLAATRAELQTNEDERASVVRDAYMYGPGVASPELAALHMAESSSPNDVADVLHMLDVVLVDHGLLVDESVRLTEASEILADRANAAREEREREADAADAARDEAAGRHAEVLVLMDEAEQAVAEEQDAIAELEHQQDRAQRQIAQLTAAREQAEGEVARRTEQAQQAAKRAERLAAEAAAAAAAAAARAVPPAPAGVAVRPVSGGLTRVGGITVASSLAPQVQALLEAARADGIVLGGYGYRSVETTIRLRRANGCPDVWTSPSSSCRVPTARPGSSMHERGLAIDFSWNGRTLCYPNPPSRCYGNPAFDWLRAHASQYGLHGLSSEAWHFSTNGR